MHFTVIPFFLAANVAVNNTSEWIHGPEFIYHTSSTIELFEINVAEPTYAVNMTTVMKCRPNSKISNLCTISNIVMHGTDPNTPANHEFEGPFQITFNTRGVENIMFAEMMDNEKVHVVKSFANELSIGTDFEKNANALPAFETKQTHILGDCMTFFRVFQEDNNKERVQGDATKKRHYTLNVLTLPEQKADSTVVITKRTEQRRCVSRPKVFYNPIENFNKVRSNTRMEISNAGTFQSQTEIKAPNIKTHPLKTCDIHVTTSIVLTDIQPAKEALPSVNFGESTSLRIADEVESNHVFMH